MKIVKLTLATTLGALGMTGFLGISATASNLSISKDEAKNIALQQFQGQVIELSYDRDDQVPHYEVTILTNTEEVEVDIHAYTGEILTIDRELIQDKNYFKDVDLKDSSNLPILWAKSRGLINGYADGTFKANNIVTEAQFAKMLVNYFNLKSISDSTSGNINTNLWSDEYYQTLAAYGVPLNGYFNTSSRNTTVKRGVVAQALAYLADGKTNLTDSIQYLITNEITVGQDKSYENKDIKKYFGSNNSLTRKQVVTFLNRMDNKEIVDLSSVTLDRQKDLANLTVNEQAKKGSNLLDSSLYQGGNTTESTTPSITKIISRDKAIAIAKQKANGTVTKIELDYEKGTPIYEIEIRNGYKEYDIKINAYNGNILKFESENEYVSSPSKPTDSTNIISRDEAIVIAKQKANGTVTKIELDYEKGTPIYEIEIRNGYIEYEFKINAQTGKIIEMEKDYDD